ncbi:MAG: transposon-encoded TnpW family protein [Oscillospiraceae bacterium]|jgi:hypothetical protein|nr:transposon-encoded TnpW family protein [Oscillospiraceae bacterium]
MNTLKNPREKETSRASEPYRFTKRLGSTTFLVSVHSSSTNPETANDKIARLIKNGAAIGKAAKIWKEG